MSELLGFVLLYVIPGLLSLPIWWGVRRLNKDWEARAFMDSVRPEPWQVHHLERITGIVKREP